MTLCIVLFIVVTGMLAAGTRLALARPAHWLLPPRDYDRDPFSAALAVLSAAAALVMVGTPLEGTFRVRLVVIGIVSALVLHSVERSCAVAAVSAADRDPFSAALAVLSAAAALVMVGTPLEETSRVRLVVIGIVTALVLHSVERSCAVAAVSAVAGLAWAVELSWLPCSLAAAFIAVAVARAAAPAVPARRRRDVRGRRV